MYILNFRKYTDGSGSNDRIAAAAVRDTHHQTALLGTTSDAQVFHGELAGIDLALHTLLQRTPEAIEPTTSVIYSDNQAALRFLQKGNLSHSQILYKSIIYTAETLANYGI